MLEYSFREITPILDPGDFQQVIDCPEWNDLTPNFSTPSALPPQFLTEERINLITQALGPGSLLTKIDPTDHTFKPELEVEDLGKLSFVGMGESKWCYLLSSEDQRKMAILVGGANAQFRIPKEPRIHVVTKEMGKFGLSYSDLRTYLCLPVNLKTNFYNGPISLMFQEWGGENTLEDPKDPRIKIGSDRVINYLLRRGHSVSPTQLHELSHPRHHLLNMGPDASPAIIDIPFESSFY